MEIINKTQSCKAFSFTAKRSIDRDWFNQRILESNQRIKDVYDKAIVDKESLSRAFQY